MASLVKDLNIIDTLEKDLVGKIQEFVTAQDIDAVIHGVFSLDDLENKLENDLQGGLGIGVGFLGREVERSESENTSNSTRTVYSSNAGAIVSYTYLVVLAVPTDGSCNSRLSATQILTLLQAKITASAVGDSDEVPTNSNIIRSVKSQRNWEFLKDGPSVAESTATLLFYTQYWKLRIPIIKL